MIILVKEPGEYPQVRNVENTLKALQDIVDGYIETVQYDEDILLVCNEEGRIWNMKRNVTIMGNDFLGTIFFVKTDGEEFTDLTTLNIGRLMREMTFLEDVERMLRR